MNCSPQGPSGHIRKEFENDFVSMRLKKENEKLLGLKGNAQKGCLIKR